MQKTIDLLDKALATKRASAWSRQFNVTESAISVARKRGRLSPTLAGQFAIALKEDPVKWTAIAALEAEPETPLLQKVKDRVFNIIHIA